MADGLFPPYNRTQPPPLPPPPPPLPPPPAPRRAVLARLAQPFIGTSRPPSRSENGSSALSTGTSTPHHPPPATTSAPNQLDHPRTIKYDLASPILAISAHRDGDKVVIAGREILRILRVGSSSDDVEEMGNLRLPGENKRHSQYDVKWGTHPASKNTIATAGTNGVICLYDVETGRLDRTLKEHGRQVHKLDFNSANGHLLLSASQDGTVKMWDMREKGGSRLTYYCKAEAARDVQWNSANAVEFAAAFDNGVIQRWDYRQTNICERKINAHNGPVFSIDWHPDGKHCASGGRDRAVKVWDFYADPRKKPKHTIWSMSSVNRCVWRPLNSRYASNQTTELATMSASNNDFRIHICDLKRPYVPTRIIDVHEASPTGLIWRDEDLLWSCSKDNTFYQHDIGFAPKPIDSLSHSTLAFSPTSEFTFASQQRRVRRRNTVAFNIEDELTLDRRRHSHSGSFKPSKSAMKPDSILDAPLEKYAPTQSAAKVEIPCLFDTEAFLFMAERYAMDTDQMSLPLMCERNARVALVAQQYRTAQTWRILKLAVEAEDRVHIGLIAQQALRSGGTTPMAIDSPVSAPTPKQQKQVDEHLRLPPSTFGHSLSSSTASTDGDDSSPEPSPGDTHKPKKRPALSVDTTKPVEPPSTSIDSNQRLPLFTSTSRSSDPLSAAAPQSSNTPPNFASSLSATNPTPPSLPVLARRHSLASDLTSSSYAATSATSPLVPNPLPTITELLPPSPTPHRSPSPSVNPLSTATLISRLIPYYTSTGDLSTTCTLLLLFSPRLIIPPQLTADIIDAYTTLLHALNLPAIAAAIRKQRPPEDYEDEGHERVDWACEECGRAEGWCAAGCGICGVLKKRQRWTVCGGCGHGGCEGCLRGWFLEAQEEACPVVGCVCNCLPRDEGSVL